LGYAASQAHGQAHKPNAQKPPCPRACLALHTGNNLKFIPTKYKQLNNARQKGEHITKVLLQVGLDLIIFSSSNVASFVRAGH